MSGLFGIFIFFIVIVLTAVLFFGWVAFSIVRFVLGGVGSLFAPARGTTRRPPVGSRVTNTVQCSLRMCGAINPADAKFCRRCGRGLPAAQRVQVRRAAVW
jgi:ribosomal protein L40E